MKIEVDVEQFARDIKASKSIGGSKGALGPFVKQLTKVKEEGRNIILNNQKFLSCN